MAPSIQHSFRNSLLLYLVLFLFTTPFLVSSSFSLSTQPQRRKMLDLDIEEDGEVKPKKKSSLLSTSKNQTKLIKPKTNSTKSSNTTTTTNLSKPLFKKLNSTKSTNTSTTTSLSKSLSKKLNSTSKATNSTKLTTLSTKKVSSSDLTKLEKPKNKTQPITTTTKQTQKITIQKLKQQKPKTPDWTDIDVDEDFISEFRDLPTKFHKTLLPDLERFSLTSKAYMSKANKEISEGFRPLVGKHYAPTIASVLSCVFVLVPLLLVSLVFNKIKSYFPLQTLLIFIQVYLAIYFFILSLASLATGLEPLKFFYATSLTSYVCLQVLQTLGYALFLLLLVMNLVLVFSTDTGLGLKMLGLGQTIVGLAVGLHYYVSVFHRAVLHQPPKTNWKVHGIYATCFLVICLFARAERRKKAYLEFGGEEGKKS